MRKLLALVVFVILPGWAMLWYYGAIRPVDASGALEKVVQIPKGASTTQIAALLKEQGFIKSETAFRLYAALHDVQSALQAGGFLLKNSMHLSELVEVLTHGKGREFSITVPEGFTVREIDALIAQKGLAPSGAIEECVRTCDFSSFDDFLPGRSGLAPRGGRIEGYLFPDTYNVNPGDFVAKFFLERMLTTFRHKIVDDLAGDTAASKRPLHDVMTMASLIEKETRTDDERAVVSGILWKRHDEGMGLGVDAAVRYIQDKPTGELTVADLNVDSPYNLRKFRGLPPGPIASAGLKSIIAAVHPKESPYWYYLHGSDGVIRYAETNAEHNSNKAIYLR
jgi:UPF0755 protein